MFLQPPDPFSRCPWRSVGVTLLFSYCSSLLALGDAISGDVIVHTADAAATAATAAEPSSWLI